VPEGRVQPVDESRVTMAAVSDMTSSIQSIEDDSVDDDDAKQ